MATPEPMATAVPPEAAACAAMVAGWAIFAAAAPVTFKTSFHRLVSSLSVAHSFSHKLLADRCVTRKQDGVKRASPGAPIFQKVPHIAEVREVVGDSPGL